MNESSTPTDNDTRVSVVIPTFQRPELVVQAVRSALAQTCTVHEVVVVIDGCEPEPSLQVLAAVEDPRVRVLTADAHLGNARARNLGISVASGDWIALLDDDDRWLAQKLERQFEAIHTFSRTQRVPATPLIASCSLHAMVGGRRFLWPRLFPCEGESIDHYLFCRRLPFTGDRVVQTSTLLASRTVFLATPFRNGRRFVDQDWLLRCATDPELRLIFPDTRQPLVEWNLGNDRPRVSHFADWRRAVGWARRRRHLLGKRSHAAFLLTLASASAADSGERQAFLPLLREAFKEGRPNVAELLTHFANFALSGSTKHALARMANRLYQTRMRRKNT